MVGMFINFVPLFVRFEIKADKSPELNSLKHEKKDLEDEILKKRKEIESGIRELKSVENEMKNTDNKNRKSQRTYTEGKKEGEIINRWSEGKKTNEIITLINKQASPRDLVAASPKLPLNVLSCLAVLNPITLSELICVLVFETLFTLSV